MKILVVSFYDDNFGDMLIRTCFENILRCTLESLGVDKKDFTIEKMNQKNIEEEKILSSDLVIFAGGALFGFNYQNFLEGIKRIITLSQDNNIPVIFSSLGINNVVSCEGEQDELKNLLRSSCIKGLSVREDAALFFDYLEGNPLKAVRVCDPVVWAGQIYGIKKTDSKTVGINVVRGGLFKANGLDWKLGDEEKYLFELKSIFDKKGIDYKFFTNGSVLDCNSLYHFAEKYEIPDDKLVFPDSSKQLVQVVSGFEAIAAIRLHSSIVSYSLGVPSVNLNWNEKVPYFYKNIGYPDRLVKLDGEATKNMAQKVVECIDGDYSVNSNYLMSLYYFLFDKLEDVLGIEGKEKYDFSALCKRAEEIGVDDEDYITDLTTKIKRGAFVYYKLFKADKDKGKNIKKLEGQTSQFESEIKALTDELETEKGRIKSLGDELEAKEEEVKALEDELNVAKEKIKYNESLAEKYRLQYNAEFEKSSYYKSVINRISEKPLVKKYLKGENYTEK